MRFKRVFLINSAQSGYYGPLRPHIGLGYISEALAIKGFCYDICDMLFGYSDRQLVQKIKSFEPDLIGFNAYTYNYLKTYEFIRRIKSYFPNIPFILGGPHVTTYGAQVPEELDEVDYSVMREGEDTILELCKGKNFEQIKGLIYRKNGEIVKNPGREFNADLDSLHFPTYEKFELKRYIPEIPILSSRGCPYKCTFCQVDEVAGIKFRERDLENIFTELSYWYEKGYRRFNFMDDNFTLKPQRVYQLCDMIDSGNFNSLFMRCAGVRCDKVNKDLLKRMKDVGFRTVSFGVEGGNDKVLKSLRKGEKISTIDKTIKIACDLGFDVNLFFLIGAPLETKKDVHDSFNLALKYPVFRVNFYNIIPYPKTEIYEWIEKKGYFIREPKDYLNDLSANDIAPVFKTEEMSVSEKIELLREARRIERKVLENSVLRRLERIKVRGILGKIIAYLLSRKITEELIFKHVIIRKIFEYARYQFHALENKKI
ncbi:B12-binding domain-containing radical SAM protein [Thermodesulfobacteriota bacterium]